MHKTTNPHDKYLGSGKILKIAIKKYGKANFRKEIIAICDSTQEAYALEKELVNDEFVIRDDTYNLVGGGSISPDFTLERKQQYKKIFTGRIYNKKPKKEKILKGNARWWKGKNQSVESNNKRSESHKKIEKIECPHCKKKCDPGNSKRFHFDNCKIIKVSLEIIDAAKYYCPHCDRVGKNLAAMNRWHFDNCKLKLF